MCGIAGTFGLADPSVIHRMTTCLAHRGPDDHAYFIDVEEGVALGHRRLAIIDPSPRGRQPMADPQGRYRIIFNGEIYNFGALRAELESHGHVFSTGTDTEVLLAAYIRWGAGCLDRLRGMFAFAVWDSGRIKGTRMAEPSLFVARDRFGIKPLLYAYVDGVFCFASELRAILASGLVPRTVSRQSVWDYLSLGSVVQPRTILSHAAALPAGCWLRIIPGGSPQIQRYWDIAEAARPVAIGEQESTRELRRLLDDAARAHMIADVPVGAFLSGGLDSTAVVGLMSQFVSHPIRTYSLGFETRHQRYSELQWAKVAADRFGTDHTEVVITDDEVKGEYDRLIDAIDQPSLDGTNTYFVSRAARCGVTVSLSGIGGDELLAGYPQFRGFVRAERLAPRGLRINADIHALERFMPRRIARALEFVTASPMERYATVRRLMTEREKERSTSAAFRAGFEPMSLAANYAEKLRSELGTVAQVSYIELTGYMVDTLLRDVDAMSMAHSLEVRPVLLDHPLAEFAFGLPGELKISGTETKKIFRDAVRDLVPEEIGSRTKKGFALPLGEWLAGSMRSRAVDALESSEARAVFDRGFLQEAKSAVATGRLTDSRLWAYVVLLDWMSRNGCELEGT